jgi:ribonuclease HI
MSIPTPHFLLFSDSKSDRRQGDWRFVLQSVDGAEKLEVEDAEPEIRGERLELLAVVRGLEALEQPSRVTLITASKYVSRGLSDGLQDWRENDWQWENHGAMVPIKNRDLWQRLDQALDYHRLECRAWRVDSAEPSSRSNPARLDRSPVSSWRAEASQAASSRPTTARPAADATNGKPAVRFPLGSKGSSESAKQSIRHDLPHSVASSHGNRGMQPAAGHSLRTNWHRLLAYRRLMLDWLESIWLRLAQCGTALLPKPWLQ